MISATRRCGGDDDDLHEQGFAKPSKRRGRGGGGAAALGLGWCSSPWARVVRQLKVEVVVAQPLGLGVRRLGFRV